MTADATGTSADRCAWCGSFIAADTEPTSWKARGVRNGFTRWRKYTRLLCPACAASASVEAPWWKPEATR